MVAQLLKRCVIKGGTIMEENPFPGSVIDDWSFLDAAAQRSQCPKCSKSRKYYCYNCFIALPHIASQLPYVKLPVHIDIIKHPSEIDGKSTSPHAAVLAPDDVTIHTYPCIPDYDPDKVLLIFPCAESVTLSQIAGLAEKDCPDSSWDKTSSSSDDQSKKRTTNNSHHSEPVIPDNNSKPADEEKATNTLSNGEKENLATVDGVSGDSAKDSETSSFLTDKPPLKRRHEEVDVDSGPTVKDVDPTSAKRQQGKPPLSFNRVVFVDSTWNQTKNIVNDERLKNLQKVELHSRTTNFWRWQEGTPKTYLSTIEAIYYFMRDVHDLFISEDYKNEYDNLLFFFCHLYSKIRKASKGGKGIKAYERE